VTGGAFYGQHLQEILEILQVQPLRIVAQHVCKVKKCRGAYIGHSPILGKVANSKAFPHARPVTVSDSRQGEIEKAKEVPVVLGFIGTNTKGLKDAKNAIIFDKPFTPPIVRMVGMLEGKKLSMQHKVCTRKRYELVPPWATTC